jgi:SAM-dependent methyltransferase
MPTEAPEAIEAAMSRLYNHYFSSHAYAQRYPAPNRATLQFLLENGAHGASRILDYGCGNGRYALALLHTTQAHLTGYDISTAALNEFEEHLAQGQSQEIARAVLLQGPHCDLAEHAPFDLILLLFGVLSHLGERPARLAVLRQLRNCLGSGGRLIVTVPNIWRRRPLELITTGLARRLRQATGAEREGGNILFTRNLAGTPHQFFYHLYSLKSLRSELTEAGFALQGVAAESLLPEWVVTQYPAVGKIDALLCRWLPASLGYGIRAVARIP